MPRHHHVAALCLLTLALLLGVAPLAAAPTPAAPTYAITVRVDPPASHLDVALTVDLPAAPSPRRELVFVLNEGFKFDTFEVDGRRVRPRLDSRAPPVMFHGESATWRVPLKRKSSGPVHVAMTYSGALPGPNKGGGAIEEHLVELAVYRSWFPDFEGTPTFDYTLTADLPAGFEAASGGVAAEPSDAPEGRSLHRFVATNQHDINLVASDRFARRTAEGEGVSVAVLSMEASEAQAERLGETAVAAVSYFTTLWGPPDGGVNLSLALVDRTGQSYSRLPLMVLNEGRSLPSLEDCAAYGIAHEAAHFWWNRADVETKDDWLNEALAEYSAVRFLARWCGEDVAWAARAEMVRKAGPHKQTIADVVRSDRGAHNLYYARGGMLFFLLEDLAGPATVQRALSGFFATTSVNRASTDDLVRAFSEAGYDLPPFLDGWYRDVRTPLVLVDGWQEHDGLVDVALEVADGDGAALPLLVSVETDRGTFASRAVLTAASAVVQVPASGEVRAVAINADRRTLARDAEMYLAEPARWFEFWSLVVAHDGPETLRPLGPEARAELASRSAFVSRLDPASALVRYASALARLADEELDGALEEAQALLEMDLPDVGFFAVGRTEALLLAGWCHDARGEREQAEASYRALAELETWSEQGRLRLETPFTLRGPLFLETPPE